MNPETLRLARRRRGWTYSTLARVSGVHRKTIAEQERGQRATMFHRTHDRLTAAFAAFPIIEEMAGE